MRAVRYVSLRLGSLPVISDMDKLLRKQLDEFKEFFSSSDNLRYLEVWNFGVSKHSELNFLYFPDLLQGSGKEYM